MIPHDSPTFSIVIDNYNYARYLEKSINSALQQAYVNFEVIVVDDASTDHSKEIIASYGYQVKPIFLTKNAGQGAAFNAAFRESKGEYISFLDADDVFLENKLQSLAEKIRKHPDADMIYHQGYKVDDDLRPLESIYPQKMPQGILRNKILRVSETGFPPTSFLTFKKTFLAKILPLDIFFNRIDADFPLQMLVALLGKVVAINKPLSLYRLHGDNWFSNHEFAVLSIDDLKRLVKRTERSFFYVNKKLNELNFPFRVDPMNHRHHRRNLYILNQVSFSKHLLTTILRPNFAGIKDFIDFFAWGFDKRKQFLAINKHDC